MNRDEQRMAIGYLRGWRLLGVPIVTYALNPDGRVTSLDELPHYLTDKDAIMDVIEALPIPDQKAIAKLVVARVGDNYEAATAADMCEMLLRVKGRWK